MSKNLNNRIKTLYDNIRNLLHQNSEEQINKHREEAINQFMRYGVPTKKDENYLYSDIASWLGHEEFASNEPQNSFSEGILNQYDNGVVIADINTFASNYSDVFNTHYTKSVEDDAMMMLSRAFSCGGRVVYIPKNVVCEEVIKISNITKEDTLVLGWRDLIIVEKGALVKIHIENINYGVSNRVCEVFVGKGANVEVSEEFISGSKSLLVNTNSTMIEGDAFYKHTSINTSEGKSRINQYVTLKERNSEASIYGAVIGKGTAHIDNLTLIKHANERCRSYESFKCVASENSTTIFNGNIYVSPIAQETEAYQQNNNILLSDKAAVYTKPNLEIYADSVKCSHGATVGQLDENAIFYMRQRGIDRKEGERLLLAGFITEIIDKVSDKSLSEELIKKAEKNICTI